MRRSTAIYWAVAIITAAIVCYAVGPFVFDAWRVYCDTFGGCL